MRRRFAGILLFVFVLPGCMQDRPSPIAFQALDKNAASPQQGETQAGCDSNLASAPGQSKEYDLFKNLSSAARGCTTSPVTYQKMDTQKSDGRAGPAVSPQKEELDRAACRSEAENAAKAARGLLPGEYDIFKNTAAVQSGDIEKAEQSCMAQRGYKSVAK